MRTYILMIMMFSCGIIMAQNEFVIVENGAGCVIEKPDAQYLPAVDDFVEKINMVTGVTLSRAAETAGHKVIRFEITVDRNPATSDTFSFSFPDANTMLIRCTQISLQWALNRILEDCAGVHRLMPEECGLSYEARSRIAVPRQDKTFKPSFNLHRTLYFSSNEWYREHNFKDALRFNHDIFRYVYPHRKYGKTGYPPKIMPVHQGKRLTRLPNDNAPAQYWQPCYSSPEAVRIAVDNIKNHLRTNPDAISVALTINDNGGFCECENCAKANGGHKISQSEVYFKWVNAVAASVAREFPHVLMPALAYAQVIEPPSFNIHPNVPIVITLDLYAATDPVIMKKHKGMIESWSKKASVLGVWDYAWGYSYIPPRMYMKLQTEMMRYLHRHNARIYFLEYECMDSKEGPKPYLYAKLLWDVNLDPDKVAAKWYERCVGPDAAPYLKKYYDKWDAYFSGSEIRKTSWFESAKYVYMTWGDRSHVYALRPGDLAEFRQYMEKTLALAKSPQHRERAKFLMRRFEMIEALLKLYGAEPMPVSGIVESAAQALPLLKNVNAAAPYLAQFQHIRQAMKKEKNLGRDLYSRMPGNYLKNGGENLLIDQLSLAAPYMHDLQIKNAFGKIAANPDLPALITSAARFFAGAGPELKNTFPAGDFEQADSAGLFKITPGAAGLSAAAVSPDYHFTGRHSLKVTPGRSTHVELYHPADPSSYYLMTFRVFIPKCDSEAYLTYALYAAKNDIPQQWHNLPKTNIAAGTWHFFAMSGLTRADSNQISASIYFGNFNPAEAVYIDDVKVVKIGSTPPVLNIDTTRAPALAPVPSGFRKLPLHFAPNHGLAKDLLLEKITYPGNVETLKITGSRDSRTSHFYYLAKPLPVKAGAEIEYILKVRGDGNFIYGAYSRDAADGFLKTELTTYLLDDDWQEIRGKVKLEQPDGKPPVAQFRPLVGFASAGGTAEIASIYYRIAD